VEKFDYHRRSLSKWRRMLLRKKVKHAGLWFVDIPRTSSSSIKSGLTDAFGREYGKSYDRESGARSKLVVEDHTPALKVRRLLGDELWEQLFTFSFVRNPWDRFYSLYCFRRATKCLAENLSFYEYVEKLEEFRFRDRDSPFSRHEYHLPMLDYLKDHEDNLVIQRVFRFEERESSLKELSERVGIALKFSKKEVLSESGRYRKVYDSRTKDIVARFYKDDIEYFEYDF